MRFIILSIISIIIILSGYVGFHYFSSNAEPPSMGKSEPRNAPKFELGDATGHKIRLLDLQGNGIILHFWASWCAPCLEEIPHWIELSTRFQEEKVKLVAVSLDDRWEDALRILPSHSLPRNVLSLLDPSGKVAEEYGSFQYPETYLLGKDLKILMKWVGPQDWGSAEIQTQIKNMLQSQS